MDQVPIARAIYSFGAPTPTDGSFGSSKEHVVSNIGQKANSAHRQQWARPRHQHEAHSGGPKVEGGRAGGFLFFYFLFLFFTKIYFRVRNLHEYMPAAPLPGGRDLAARLPGGRGLPAKKR